MKKLTITFIIFVILLLGAGAGISIHENRLQRENLENVLIQINEISQLYEMGNNELAATKSSELRSTLTGGQGYDITWIWIIDGCALCFLIMVYLYSYFRLIRPFDRLKGFASQLSQGDFDTGLEYTRSDYFGDFTWAFDNMRTEILKARKCEKEAIENNKTVIASLSHDIKTPVASLRAYTEGLEANMDTTPEKRQKYLEVILRKCDDIARLTNDMTIHSLSGLDRLLVQCEPLDLCELTQNVIHEINPDSGKHKIRLSLPEHPINVHADPGRMAQIVENLVNNSNKYAGTDIEITVSEIRNSEGGNEPKAHVLFELRDYGPGIPNKDMPFIFDKFYRGHNITDQPGSGLGLFIVKYLVEKQGGSITLSNSDPGLTVRIIF